MELSVPAWSTSRVVLAAAAVRSSTKLAPNVLMVVLSGTVRVLIPERLETSLSMRAPALVTLAVSVTSARASIPSSLVPSVATSLPSIVLSVVMAPSKWAVPWTKKSVVGSSDLYVPPTITLPLSICIPKTAVVANALA